MKSHQAIQKLEIESQEYKEEIHVQKEENRDHVTPLPVLSPSEEYREIAPGYGRHKDLRVHLCACEVQDCQVGPQAGEPGFLHADCWRFRGLADCSESWIQAAITRRMVKVAQIGRAHV